MSDEWVNVKAALWINRLPESRGGLCAGCKIVLQALWDHVGKGIERDTQFEESPYVSVETLAESRGAKPDTVQARLDKLTALGWIRRERGRRFLAWRAPFGSQNRDSNPGDIRESSARDQDSNAGESVLESRSGPESRQDSNPGANRTRVRRPGLESRRDQDSNPDNQDSDQIGSSQDQATRGRATRQPHHLEATSPQATTDAAPTTQPTANHPPPDSTTDSRSRHQQIRKAQGWDRSTDAKPPPIKPAPSPLPPDVQQALDAWPNRGRWAMQIEQPRWEKSLAEACSRLNLDGPTVIAVLEYHDAESERLKAAGSLRSSSNEFPSRVTLWWASSTPEGRCARQWLNDALVEIEKRNRTSEPSEADDLDEKLRRLDPCSLEYMQLSTLQDERRAREWQAWYDEQRGRARGE